MLSAVLTAAVAGGAARRAARGLAALAPRAAGAGRAAAAAGAGAGSSSSAAAAGRRTYVVSAEARRQFREFGYTVLKGFMTEAELAPLDAAYARFMRREVAVPGKDFCDMSQAFDTPFSEYRIVNAMLPTKYDPSLKGNAYEVRAAAAAKQLLGRDDMTFDYDQLLNKNPRQEKAVFAWHQDAGYWPSTPDMATATFSLALDATTRANGCLKFVPGSQLAARQARPPARTHRQVARRRARHRNRRGRGARARRTRRGRARRRVGARRVRDSRLGRQHDRRAAAHLRRRLPHGRHRRARARRGLHAQPQRHGELGLVQQVGRG